MSETFWIDADIDALRDSSPIRFAHHKSIDKPESHVLHLNNYVEIYVYISGNHQYIVEDSLYNLKCGDIIIINPREVHKVLALEETMYERFYFLVSEHIFDFMNTNPLTQLLSCPNRSGNLISPDEKTRKEVLKMLYSISDCYTNGKTEHLRAFSFFMRFLDEINRHTTYNYETSVSPSHTPHLLKEALAYIAENTATIQSITEVSTALGVTPQYLSAYFCKHTGTPPKKYIQAKKIALAKTLLDKDADVTTACFDSGFNDCSYFIRIFKEYVGKTPLNYKQTLEKITER